MTLSQSPYFYKGPTLGASLSFFGIGLSLGMRQTEHLGVEFEWRRYPTLERRYTRVVLSDMDAYGDDMERQVHDQVSGQLFMVNGIYYFNTARGGASHYFSAGIGLPKVHFTHEGDPLDPLELKLLDAGLSYQFSLGSEMPMQRALLDFEYRLTSRNTQIKMETKSASTKSRFEDFSVLGEFVLRMKYRL